jgi:hypothetical protein
VGDLLGLPAVTGLADGDDVVGLDSLGLTDGLDVGVSVGVDVVGGTDGLPDGLSFGVEVVGIDVVGFAVGEEVVGLDDGLAELDPLIHA